MTLEDLRRYMAVKATINALQRQIDAIYLSTPPKPEVQGGRNSAPQAGDPTHNKAMLIVDKKDILKPKLDEYIAFTEEVESWLDTVEDPHIEQIIRLHFMSGLSWAETSEIMYGIRDYDYCRKMIKRYFKKMSEKSE